jgi:hypothetical protein
VASAFIFADLTHNLKERGVFHLTVSLGWWEAHFGDAGAPKSNMSKVVLADSLPSFLNRQRNTIMLSPQFDPAESNYLAVIGNGNVRSGMILVLDREPEQLIDWLADQASNFKLNTTINSCFSIYVSLPVLLFPPERWSAN